MRKDLIIREYVAADLSLSYDAFFGAIGYESRSRFVAETVRFDANRRFGMTFENNRVLSFSENLAWHERKGFEIADVSQVHFRSWFTEQLIAIDSSSKERTRILVDYSSLDRFRIASIIDSLNRTPLNKNLDVDFLYSLAKFTPPSKKHIQNRVLGPVIPAFAGWATEPDIPPLAVVGLGYEVDKALGAVEQIQASEIWTFIPNSDVKDFYNEVLRANQTLLDEIPTNRKIDYLVAYPNQCFYKLESLVHRLVQVGNPILLPFGPKVFTLCSLLLGCLYPNVAVWRVSAANDEVPVDRKASGFIYGISVSFEAPTAAVDTSDVV